MGADTRVRAVNRLGAEAGITVGMRRRQAEAVCPAVVTLPGDEGAEAARFEPVVAAVEELVPRVEVVAPGLMLVPVSGAVGYYGGERRLAERVMELVGSVAGDGFRFGIASSPFLARRAAREADPLLIVDDDAAFLASLDIAAIDREDLVATFRWLGITTLGELARLPRAAVVSRFGSEGMHAHRLASGEDRPVVARSLPPDIAVEERFSPPVVEMERAAFAARGLANRLVGALAVHGTAAHRVLVVAEAADGTVRSRVWRSADPFADTALADRVRWQLRAWMEEPGGGGIGGGLALLRIEPSDVSGTGRQLSLTEDAAEAMETQRSLNEVRAIVGDDGLLGARPQGGRDPGERVLWHRWGEDPVAAVRDPEAPWPGRIPEPSPALVPPEPRSLTVEWDGGMPTRVRLASRWETVLSWAGPWRHVGRWWTGEGSAERYQLVTSAGAFLCEVRPEGTTWLLGIYD